MSAKRVLRNALIGLAIAVVLGAGVLWYALYTESGARRLIAFALGKSSAGVEITDVRGRIQGPLILLGIKYRSGALSAVVDSVWLDWRPWNFIKGQVLLDRLDVTGVRVTMADSVPADSAGTGRARRERPKPPFDIVLGQTSVRDVEVKVPGDMSLRADSARLTGRLEDYRIEMEGTASVPKLRELRLRIAGRGNLEQVTLDSSTTRFLDGRLLATGKLEWWPLIGWDLRIAATGVRPSLVLDSLAALPGTLDLFGATQGVIDTIGPVGTLVIDSLGGVLRGHPVSGHGEIGLAGTNAYDLRGLDVRWGSVNIGASGTVRDTIALSYAVAVADLRQAMPTVRGSATVRGTANGPRLTPQVRAAITGRALAYGTNRLDRVVGRANVDLIPNGRNDVDLHGTGGSVGTHRFAEVVLAIRGRRFAHTIDARVTAPSDTLHLALTGGLRGKSWSGTIRDLAVETAAAGDWQLEQPAALVASPASARLARLCIVADSAGGRACAEGAWQGGTTWNALATVDGVPFQRLPFSVLNAVAGGRAAFTGTLGARLEARAAGGRLDATLRAVSDTVTFRYREGADTVYRRLALDSAAVDVRADRGGLLATLGLRLVDNAAKEVAVLAGKASLPSYRLGDPLANETLDARLDGKIGDLSLARPLFATIDTLAGAVTLTATVTGTVGAPQVKGAALIDKLVAGMNRRSLVSGGAELVVDGRLSSDKVLTGRAQLTPRQLVYEYQRLGDVRRVTVDSGSVEMVVGSDGLHGKLRVDVADSDSGHVATIRSELALPHYRRFGDPLQAQPVTLALDVVVPDLEVFEPLVPQVDSLHGNMNVNVRVTGTVGTPSVTGKLVIEQAAGELPFGTMVRGGLTGDLATTVQADSTLTGTLRVTPRNLRLEYVENGVTRVVRLDGSALDVQAGPKGIRGALGLTVARPDSGVMATFKGDLELPQYTHVGRPLAPQPIRATLTGRADDLSFLRTFTSQVDSSAGRMTLDAKLDGTLGESHLVGRFKLTDAAAHFPNLGILVHDVQLDGSGDLARSIKIDGRMRSGPGNLTIQGTTPVTPTSDAPGRIEIRSTNFEAVNNGQVHAIVTSRLNVGLKADTIDVRGRIDLPVARVVLSEIPEFAVAPSKDVIFV
ncbi:MAG: hypothetical protein ABI647_23655, partial [Gemmatimonadota bacterium]